MLDEISGEKEAKLMATQDFFLYKKDEIARNKEKIKKYQANIGRLEKEQKYLRQLQNLMLDGEKFKSDEYTFFYRKTKSVNIIPFVFDESKENKYCKISVSPDKSLIKKDLESGIEIMGAEIEVENSLSVR